METIVSKLSILYNIRLIGLIVFWIVFIYLSVSYSLSHYDYTPRQIVYLISLCLVLVGLGVYKLWVGVVNRIIVSREDITIYFLITNKQLVVKHTDVKAIYDLGGDSGKQGRVFGYRIQELELHDGSSIRFTDMQFTNYTELKHKLWEYRLLAYAELRESQNS
jgi:hypothetical protein